MASSTSKGTTIVTVFFIFIFTSLYLHRFSFEACHSHPYFRAHRLSAFAKNPQCFRSYFYSTLKHFSSIYRSSVSCVPAPPENNFLRIRSPLIQAKCPEPNANDSLWSLIELSWRQLSQAHLCRALTFPAHFENITKAFLMERLKWL